MLETKKKQSSPIEPPDPDFEGAGQSDLVNALSVDIEDWFQVGAFENVIHRSDWDDLELRAARNCDIVLDIFDQANVRATFFTLAWVAERLPAMMRKIADAGHEIASHGYDHKRVFQMTPKEFSKDLKHSRKILEDSSGQAITGYRAPSFSIDRRTPWAHEILTEHGYVYSSSVAPIRHDHYGWHGSPRFAWKPVSGSDLIELPVTTVRVGNQVLAAGGGGFFRLFPYALYDLAIGKMHKDDGHGAIFYFHPWEVDPKQPRVGNAPLKSKLRHYARLGSMESKLRRLAESYSWDRMDVLARLELEQYSETEFCGTPGKKVAVS